ncbi:MAG: CHAD domain-containing protein [Planctomycetes bacterium]|nr:CHAD domain-containing protein [Planctomycetota bacterium]NBY02919.1 CHAD domain-containing protein [Planctomycetota bacterium]
MTNNEQSNPWQPQITNETSLNDGFKYILSTRLHTLAKILNKQNINNDLSPKLVHSLRVASRKLITAIKLFKQVATKKIAGKPHDRTKDLMDHFGPIRNWDVFYNACNNYNNKSTPEMQDLFLQGVIWAIRNRFEKKALLFLRLKAEKLESRLLKTATKIYTTKDESTSTSFFEWSRISLMKILDDFKTSISTIDYSKKELHAFRLKIKFVRYGLEIMGDAIPLEKSFPLHEALKKGQTILGTINDLHFQIEQTFIVQSSLKNQKETFFLTDFPEENSFLKHCQQMLETNMELFKSWLISTAVLIEF